MYATLAVAVVRTPAITAAVATDATATVAMALADAIADCWDLESSRRANLASTTLLAP